MSRLSQRVWRLGTPARAALACAALCLCALSPVRAQSPAETVLHTFNSYADGTNPYSNLIQGIDGNFYGTTYYGGTNGYGTIFKVTPSGVLTTLYSFTYTTDGGYPYAGLIQGSDGTLYGTTYNAPGSYYGTVFSIHPDGTSYQTLHSFSNAGTDGEYPVAGLIQGSDGKLYGTTRSGGANGYGIVFQLSTDGTIFNVLHSFSNAGTDGGSPYAGVIQASDGKLYGTCQNGGANGYGIVYQLTTDGTVFNLLHSFSYSTDGGYPDSALIQGSDGKLYGTTRSGGASSNGTVFQLSTDGMVFNVLHSFSYTNGGNLYAGVIQGSDGNLYGTCQNGGTNGYGVVFQLSTDGTIFNVLHSFSNAGIDGGSPYAGVIQASDGKLYGTTYRGGQPQNIGTIFSVTTDGKTFNSLYQFTNGFIDGRNPYYGTLTLGKDGNYYGTTETGGVYNQGTLYKLTPTGTITLLHSFYSANNDGYYPYGGLAMDSKGVLYGTAYYGGAFNAGVVYSYNSTSKVYTILNDFGGSGGANLPTGLTIVGSTLFGVSYRGGQFNSGVVFKLTLPTSSTPASETVLHSFQSNGVDGYYPNGLLLVGKNKYLYGTTTSGGQYGYGTVFKVSQSGSSYKLLHNFNYSTDGSSPYAGLVQGSDGTLYGTTYSGGSGTSYGSVFKLNTDGSGFTTLRSFSYNTDGGYPLGGVMIGTDGKLYGTTSNGGGFSGGTAWSLNPSSSSSFTVLHNFNQIGDGYNPYSGVLEGSDGNLYGTTFHGGIAPEANTNVEGTVYQLQTALPIVSSFSPTSGSVSAGTAVTLKGFNLTNGAVTIDGVAQTVTSSSATSLTFKLTTGTPTGSFPIVVTTTTGSYNTGTKLFKVNP